MSAAVEHDNVTKLPDFGSYERPFDRRDAETLSTVFRSMGIELRYNMRARRIELRQRIVGLLTDGVWTAANDRRMADLFDSIARQYFVKTERGPRALAYGREARADALNALSHHKETDPFVTWLEEDLPPWDGVSRLEGLLVENFGAPDDPLSHWAGRAPLIGAIQRAYEPGAKIDEVAVLIGNQGLGKSAYGTGRLKTVTPAPTEDDLIN